MFYLIRSLMVLTLVGSVSCSSQKKYKSNSEIEDFSSLTCPERVMFFDKNFQLDRIQVELIKIRKELGKKYYQKAISKMVIFPRTIKLYDFTDEETLSFLNRNEKGQAILGRAMTRLGFYEADGPGGQILTPPHYFYNIVEDEKVSLYLFKRASGRISLLASVWPENRVRETKDIFNFFLVAGQKTKRVTQIDEEGRAKIYPLSRFCEYQ